MPIPSNRTPIRIARGTLAEILANVTELKEGEIIFAYDQTSLFVKRGDELVDVTGITTTTIENEIKLSQLSDVAASAVENGSTIIYDTNLQQWIAGPQTTVSEILNGGNF